MILIGNKLYERCADCGEIVCINKPFFGSLHLCLHPGETNDLDPKDFRPLTKKDIK